MPASVRGEATSRTCAVVDSPQCRQLNSSHLCSMCSFTRLLFLCCELAAGYRSNAALWTLCSSQSVCNALTAHALWHRQEQNTFLSCLFKRKFRRNLLRCPSAKATGRQLFVWSSVKTDGAGLREGVGTLQRLDALSVLQRHCSADGNGWRVLIDRTPTP